MAEIIDMQNGDVETPKEEKASNVSNYLCHNSNRSYNWCFHW